MPQKKVKKGLKKLSKKKTLEDQPLQVRHEREGNLNYYSEEVARFIIEKLISLAITTQGRNTIYSHMGDICYTHVQKEIKNYIQTQFISYDRDDMLFSETNQNNNNSLLLTEDICPISKVSNEPDKEENNQLNNLNSIIPLHLDTKVYYDITFDKENFWGDIPHPSTTVKDRDAGTQIDYKKYEPDDTIKDVNESLYKSIKPTEKPSSSGLRISFKKKNSISIHHFTNSLNSNADLSPTKKKVYPMDFPSFDIPSEKIPKRKELPEIQKLRDEREKMIKQKQDEELKKKLKAEEIKKELNQNSNYSTEKKGGKKYSNYTIDAKGKIVIIKSIPVEALQDEFTVGRSEQKEVEFVKDPNFSMSSISRFDSLNKIKNKKEEVIYNPNLYYDNTDKSTQSKVKNFSSIIPVKPSSFRSYRRIEKDAIPPCGSNFDLIRPEIGVTVLEESKVKSGGRDYFRKFNKYSVENFNQTLKDTLYNQSINNDNVNQFKKKTQVDNTSTQKTNNGSSIHTNNIEENMKNSNEGRTLNKSQSTGNIIMSTFKFPSIRAAMDNLDLLNERDEQFFDSNNKTSYLGNNLFNNMKKLNFERTSKFPNKSNNDFSEINKFTRTLLSNSRWGKTTMKKSGSTILPRNHIKPQQRDLEREVGMGITMTRLPRSRMKLAAQNVLMNHSAIDFNTEKKVKKKPQKKKKEESG